MDVPANNELAKRGTGKAVLPPMTVTYEAAPGRLTEVMSYLIARRFKRLSSTTDNHEQNQARYAESQTDTESLRETIEVRMRTEREMQ